MTTLTMEEFYQKLSKKEENETKDFNVFADNYEKIMEFLNSFSPDSPAWTGWWW